MHLNWEKMEGGYRLPYDPRPAIGRLRADKTCEAAWSELFEQLHHQGDVGVASYAAVPLVVDLCRSGSRDWRFFGLLTTIEVERHADRNPPLPAWLAPDYHKALDTARGLALLDLRENLDPITLQAALSLVALASGATKLGAMLDYIDEHIVDDFVDQHLDWGDSYSSKDL